MNQEFKRIEDMIAHFKEHGWATGVLEEDESAFFEAIGIPLDKLGITSFTGNDIQYYDTTCLTVNSGSFKKVLKYSKKPFHGYRHRFIVKLMVDDDFRNDLNLDVYSNSDSYEELEAFIKEKKSYKVIKFKIVHRASKEQDEATGKFIDEIFKNL